jgi:hypothetical protein
MHYADRENDADAIKGDHRSCAAQKTIDVSQPE